MDNLCHTLAGAALGEAGLKQRTAFGMATLMIASNLPDVDVAVFATDTLAMSFRRGWTHGVIGQLVLPPVHQPDGTLGSRRGGDHRTGRRQRRDGEARRREARLAVAKQRRAGIEPAVVGAGQGGRVGDSAASYPRRQALSIGQRNALIWRRNGKVYRTCLQTLQARRHEALPQGR